MQTRKVTRKATHIAGQCATGQGRVFDITVNDLSNGGCRFEYADPHLAQGAPLTLMINGTGPYQAYVRWREGPQVGVSFLRPLGDAQLDALMNGEPVATSSDHAPPDLGAAAAKPGFGPLRRIC